MFSPIISGCMNWGVWGANFSPKDMLRLIEQSIDLGITTFDHADIYGHYTTEAAFGEAMKLRPELRQQIQLISKCGIRLVTPNRPAHKLKSYDTSKKHILQSAENSLRNLQTDHLDLLLIHRPSPLMRAEEVAEAFEALHDSGKVLHFGVSNFTPAQLSLLQSFFPDLIANQIELSLLHRQPLLDGSLDQCQEMRIMPMAWSPLGGGKLFGEAGGDAAVRVRAAAQPILDRLDASLDQVLIAWLLRHPAGILPVMGTTKIQRLEKAMAACKMEMSREEWFSLWEAAEGHEVP